MHGLCPHFGYVGVALHGHFYADDWLAGETYLCLGWVGAIPPAPDAQQRARAAARRTQTSNLGNDKCPTSQMINCVEGWSAMVPPLAR